MAGDAKKYRDDELEGRPLSSSEGEEEVPATSGPESASGLPPGAVGGRPVSGSEWSPPELSFDIPLSGARLQRHSADAVPSAGPDLPQMFLKDVFRAAGMPLDPARNQEQALPSAIDLASALEPAEGEGAEEITEKAEKPARIFGHSPHPRVDGNVTISAELAVDRPTQMAGFETMVSGEGAGFSARGSADAVSGNDAAVWTLEPRPASIPPQAKAAEKRPVRLVDAPAAQKPQSNSIPLGQRGGAGTKDPNAASAETKRPGVDRGNLEGAGLPDPRAVAAKPGAATRAAAAAAADKILAKPRRASQSGKRKALRPLYAYGLIASAAAAAFFALHNPEDTPAAELPAPQASVSKKALAEVPPAPEDAAVSLVLPRESSPNAAYFEALEKRLQEADPLGAVARFRAPLTRLLDSPGEKLLGAEYAARYALLVSDRGKAMARLKPACGSMTEENAFSCVHYARALLSELKFTELRSLLNQGAVLPLPLREYLAPNFRLLGLGLAALQRPSLTSVWPLVEFARDVENLRPEWSRQAWLWSARATYMSSKQDQSALARRIFGSERSAFEAALARDRAEEGAEREALRFQFLSALASENEQAGFEGEVNGGGKSRLPESDSGFASALFALGNRSASGEGATALLSGFSFLKRKSEFSEAYLLAAGNLHLLEGGLAQFIDARQRKPQAAAFPYEWALLSARYAAHTRGRRDAEIALKELRDAARAEPLAEREPQYWILTAKLRRRLAKDNSSALARAETTAVVPRDLGLLLAERALSLSAKGDRKGALRLVSDGVRRIPGHDALLQAAAEIAGQSGADPTQFMDAEKAPPQFSRRSQEFPPLSDVTLLRLLEKL